MTDITPEAIISARESAREASGRFGAQQHSAPEATLPVNRPLTESISEYLREYSDAEESYAENGEGPDADDAYEAWEDFQTDNSGRAVALLEESKKEIDRLRAELEAERTKHFIPEVLAEAIEADHEHYEEPLLYVPEEGHQTGWVDVIAVSDGVHRKYTLTPAGEIERNFD